MAELGLLPELNPPAVMPQGNVGTPLATFMALIKACKLPAHVIKKLQLQFPKARSRRRYGAVGMDDGTVRRGDFVASESRSGRTSDGDGIGGDGGASVGGRDSALQTEAALERPFSQPSTGASAGAADEDSDAASGTDESVPPSVSCPWSSLLQYMFIAL